MLGRENEIKTCFYCLIYGAHITNSKHSVHLTFVENDKETRIHGDCT